ncbi:MAG: trehalase family glycosidase, partial [Candidatus Gracilibacteria bacterium]
MKTGYITIAALLIFSAFTISAFYPKNNNNDPAPANEITPMINFTIDKTAFQALDTAEVKIEVDKRTLPIVLKIARYDIPDKDHFSQEINNENPKLSILLGGELGAYKMYLEKNGNVISPELRFELTAKNFIATGDKQLDSFFPQVKKWMLEDISSCDSVKGYRSPDTNTIWLRDHTYQMKAFKYWETNMAETLDYFLSKQTSDGALPDFICPASRIGVEADVEYLSVLAAYEAWQATGNDEWIFSILPKLEKAVMYSTTDPIRWDSTHNLVKRPFTIDFWDFQWGDGNTQLNNNTRFGILPSDNSGVYQASKILSKFFEMKGDKNKASQWNATAQSIKENSNKYLWDSQNGYYKSFLHIEDPVPPVETDESKILSLGNVYNINRDDFASGEQVKKIIREYQSRAGATWKDKPIFKEWFSINPDYGEKKFNSRTDAETSGGYVNGGIMPLVGGELAKGALNNGFEEYGVKNIRDYIKMTQDADNKTYLWYWPNGKPGHGSETLSTDGWGSSAFLSAFMEGLVGIKDIDKKFDKLYFSPKWPA